MESFVFQATKANITKQAQQGFLIDRGELPPTCPRPAPAH